eukprot:2778758-Rhodomonas_salina.2
MAYMCRCARTKTVVLRFQIPGAVYSDLKLALAGVKGMQRCRFLSMLMLVVIFILVLALVLVLCARPPRPHPTPSSTPSPEPHTLNAIPCETLNPRL